MDNFQIETAQNVSIQQNAAGIGERILAYLIDLLIIIAYFIVSIFILAALDVDGGDQWAFWLILGLPPFLYFLLWETFWDGKTPGKATLKIKVVKLDGSRPAFSNYLIRWLLRLLDITFASGGVAVVTILLKGTGQRLGDMAAGTTVISEKQRVRFHQTILVDIPEGYVPTYPQVTVFSDAEIRKIKSIYNDSKRYANHNVILELSKKMGNIMEVTPQEKPLQFVAKVIEDYNYYTQKL
ncbi:RDD family protein [Aquimarina sp. 2201CG5-10]|uniref:RDD family protein n=1 Tax=Aquimarina callyspongiae TaxID=3098150 RepID=UPI002AB3D8D1|nr:RDD family protein [Aquimarina sp. 2201CG5-10]MDY8137405.1 RDD family protein [Aquimarina sp. 2201CG5-10]